MSDIQKKFLVHAAQSLVIALASAFVAVLITLLPQVSSVIPAQYALDASIVIPLLVSALRSAQQELAKEQAQAQLKDSTPNV